MSMNHALFADSAKNDFAFFVRAVWEDRNLSKVAPLSSIEMDMADFACHGPRLRGILGFRGVGKTMLTVATLTCFRLLRDSERQIIIISKSTGEARKTTKLIRTWIEQIWFLRHMTPQAGSDNAQFFNIATRKDISSRQPSLSCFGIEGQLEGNRAHTILPDDIETKGNTKTREAREELKRLTGEFKNILYPHREYSDGGPIDPVEICFQGTPKHEESLYQNRIEAGYTFRSYPIRIPTPSEDVIALAPIIKDGIANGKYIPGKPLLPRRFPQQEISEREAEGYSEFARENMLIANLAETNRYPLRLSDLIVMDIDPHKAPIYVAWGKRDHNGSTALDIPSLGFGEDTLHRPIMIDPTWVPYQHTVAWIDPAGRGQDHTGIAIIGVLNGFLWVKYLGALPGGSSEHDIATICQLCRAHHANSLYIESNADTLGTYRSLFRTILNRHYLEPHQDIAYPKGWKCSFVDDPKVTHQTGHKEERIIAYLEPVLSTHRLIISPQPLTPPSSIPIYQHFQYQLTRLTKERKCLREDGIIDSLAGAVKAAQHALSGDPLTGKERIEQREMDKHIKQARQLLKRVAS